MSWRVLISHASWWLVLPMFRVRNLKVFAGGGMVGSSPWNDESIKGVTVELGRPQLLARGRPVGGHCLRVSHASPRASVNNPRGY